MLRYGTLFALAGLLSLCLTPWVSRLAVWLGAVDRPESRRVNTRPVPRLGGLAIFGGLVLAFLVGLLIDLATPGLLIRDGGEILALGLATSLILMVGFLDDVRGLSPSAKLALQIGAAGVAVASGYQFETAIGVPLGLFAVPLSLLWIVAITNAFNLIDGLDGLAAGVALMVTATLFAVAVTMGRATEALVLAALGGALLGFLRYNFYPARIFLGDSGSMSLGFLLALVSIEASAKLPATVAILVPLLALGLPITDTVLSMTRRLLARVRVIRREEERERYEFEAGQGPGIFAADRGHIHHRLLDLGLSHPRAVLVLYGVSLVFCLGAFLLLFERRPNVSLLLGAFAIAAVVGIRRLGYGEIRVLRNGALLPLFDFPLVNRRMLHVVADLCFIVAAFLGATLLWSGGEWAGEVRETFVARMPMVAFAQIGAFALSGLYQGSYRYTGIPDLLVMFRALALAVAGGWIALWAGQGFAVPTLALVVLDGYLLATLAIGSRISFRVLDFLFKKDHLGERRALIYGAGNGGVMALREIRGNPAVGMRAVGFLDDDGGKRMRTVHGVPVFGTEQLEQMITERTFDELIVSTTKISRERLSVVAERCAFAGIPVRRFSIGWEDVDEPPVAVSEEPRAAAKAPAR